MITFFILGATFGLIIGMFAGAGWVEVGKESFSVFVRTQLYRVVGFF